MARVRTVRVQVRTVRVRVRTVRVRVRTVRVRVRTVRVRVRTVRVRVRTVNPKSRSAVNPDEVNPNRTDFWVEPNQNLPTPKLSLSWSFLLRGSARKTAVGSASG